MSMKVSTGISFVPQTKVYLPAVSKEPPLNAIVRKVYFSRGLKEEHKVTAGKLLKLLKVLNKLGNTYSLVEL